MSEHPLFMNLDLPKDRPALPDDFGMDSPVLVISPGRNSSDPIEAVVMNKARVWVTVTPKGRRFRRDYRFRIKEQHDGEDQGIRYRFCTPEQYEWDQAQKSAHGYLREQMIHVGSSSLWFGRIVELARAVYLAQLVSSQR